MKSVTDDSKLTIKMTCKEGEACTVKGFIRQIQAVVKALDITAKGLGCKVNIYVTDLALIQEDNGSVSYVLEVQVIQKGLKISSLTFTKDDGDRFKDVL